MRKYIHILEKAEYTQKYCPDKILYPIPTVCFEILRYLVDLVPQSLGISSQLLPVLLHLLHKYAVLLLQSCKQHHLVVRLFFGVQVHITVYLMTYSD